MTPAIQEKWNRIQEFQKKYPKLSQSKLIGKLNMTPSEFYRVKRLALGKSKKAATRAPSKRRHQAHVVDLGGSPDFMPPPPTKGRPVMLLITDAETAMTLLQNKGW